MRFLLRFTRFYEDCFNDLLLLLIFFVIVGLICSREMCRHNNNQYNQFLLTLISRFTHENRRYFNDL